MNFYDPMVGSDISSAAKVLCRFIPCRMEFNGIRLRSRTGSTPASIVADFHREWHERARQYRESSEGQADALRISEEIAAAQQVVDALIAELRDVELTTATDALRWLERFRDPAGRVGVEKDVARIIDAFEAAGWVRNDCVGHPEVGTNSSIFARWLVGQAMDGIAKVGTPRPIFHHFLEQWRGMTCAAAMTCRSDNEHGKE